jgi:NTP pyrophosphatase (non-canonical NTP hydrolase)
MDMKTAQDTNFNKYHNTIARRGPDKCFQRLVEEVGEVAKALRNGDPANLAEELGDCQAWLFTVASANGIDLNNAYMLKYGNETCFRCQQEKCICPEINHKKGT